MLQRNQRETYIEKYTINKESYDLLNILQRKVPCDKLLKLQIRYADNIDNFSANYANYSIPLMYICDFR